jgi:hypothetical protein
MTHPHNLSFHYHADITTKGLWLGSAKVEVLCIRFYPIWPKQGRTVYIYTPFSPFRCKPRSGANETFGLALQYTRMRRSYFAHRRTGGVAMC